MSSLDPSNLIRKCWSVFFKNARESFNCTVVALPKRNDHFDDGSALTERNKGRRNPHRQARAMPHVGPKPADRRTRICSKPCVA